MRVLVLGAGATGGYYGGLLLDAGRDVTFLVRPGRAEQLADSGLIIRSPLGDTHIVSPSHITAAQDPFDLIILSCKAYHLDDAIRAITPAVGENSMILPILNGMKHLDILDQHFGSEKVLGGACIVSSTLDADGAIVQFGKAQTLVFGEREGGISARCTAIAGLMAPARFTAKLSDNVMQDMWEKWVANSTVAGITCLMRNTVGNIVSAPGGKDLIHQLFSECCSVAAAYGFPPSTDFRLRNLQFFNDTSSDIAASMCRDILRGAPTEGDHVLGDMIAHAQRKDIHVPALRIAYCNVKAYDIQRSKMSLVPMGAK